LSSSNQSTTYIYIILSSSILIDVDNIETFYQTHPLDVHGDSLCTFLTLFLIDHPSSTTRGRSGHSSIV